MKDTDLVAALRASAPYVHAHNGRVFVIAFGGEAAERPDFDRLIYDIGLLHSLGVKLVLIHGARPQVDAELSVRDITSDYVDGVRVTDGPTLECVMSAVGRLRMEIEAKLSTSLASTPMGGARLKIASGNWITGRPLGVRQGVDMQYTGDVRRVDVQAIRTNLESGRICLLSPIGYSPTGEIFNLRAEDVATAVAAALSADKLMFLVPSDPAKWPLADAAGDAGQMSVTQAETLLREKGAELSAEDKGCLTSVTAAARGGVKRVHLIFMGRDGALLRELYSRDGGGLLFYADDDYESTRDATIDDVGGILNLIQPLEEAGVLVPRPREQLEQEIGNFSVMVRDGLVIACAAFMPFPDSHSAELACVAVHPEYRGNARAAKLLVRIEQHARSQQIKRLFSLTTHTPHWFIERGFAQGKLEDLPMERRRLYNFQRNSLVLVKNL
ncbi:MAG TPA: amino-acid N-acetyltransferase [Candidatus Binatia bacterium]|nr:amino-acid N-acetyltransferase [Candidatus Binatia bacterium]